MPEQHFALLDREREILASLAAGKHPVAVAREKFISSRTVVNHLRNALEKVTAEVDFHDQ